MVKFMIQRTGIYQKGEIKLSDLLDFIKKNPEIDKAGAIVFFCGIVRGYTHEGKKVKKLELEAYEKEAEKVLAKISEDLRSKQGIIDVLIHHMVGTFFVGEHMVYVAVAGKSRKDVFPTVIEAVERYKHEAPIWKKEYLEEGGSYWVSEKDAKG